MHNFQCQILITIRILPPKISDFSKFIINCLDFGLCMKFIVHDCIIFFSLSCSVFLLLPAQRPVLVIQQLHFVTSVFSRPVHVYTMLNACTVQRLEGGLLTHCTAEQNIVARYQCTSSTIVSYSNSIALALGRPRVASKTTPFWVSPLTRAERVIFNVLICGVEYLCHY